MEKYGEHTPKYPEPGSNIIEKAEYTQSTDKPEQGRVWINKTQYFEDTVGEFKKWGETLQKRPFFSSRWGTRTTFRAREK